MEPILTEELLLKSASEWNKARETSPKQWPNLIEANLSGADLSEADLWVADLTRADLSGANLTNADLSRADLSRASIIQANLSGACLIEANLSGADLNEASLSTANLSGAKLRNTDLSTANLSWADLSVVDLSWANLTNANLSGANFSGAHLRNADLSAADLRNADLSRADLSGANLSGANLTNADLSGATIGYTLFGNVNLSTVKGLDTVKHGGPSTIGIDTLYESKGNIPEIFLKGCGIPDTFIEYIHSLTGSAIEFYSCFISHSTADKAFADRLYADLQAKGVRCWYAPHDMKGGKKIHDQIGEAIRTHEKLLLILSESSINSEWVKQEIIKAKKREDTEGKRVLFPIGLIEFSKIQEWEFPDSKGRDLAEEIMLYYIPSFIGWEKDNEAYTTEFGKLLNSFQAERNTEGKA